MKEYKSDDLIGHELTLSISRTKERRSVGAHTHDFIEIIYILAGDGVEYINDKASTVKRGDLLFINYGSVHSFTPHGFLDYVNICFHPEFVGQNIITRENAFALLELTAIDEVQKVEEEGIVHFHGKEREEVEHLLLTMMEEYDGNLTGRDTVLRSYMNILFVHLLRKLTVAESTDAPDLLARIALYIEENPDADLSLDTLAKKCFYNPSYFSRAFKKSFGTSLSDYIRDRKIATALTLFEDGNLTAEEVAERAGFSSASAFYRAYAKARGESFASYRGKKPKV